MVILVTFFGRSLGGSIYNRNFKTMEIVQKERETTQDALY